MTLLDDKVQHDEIPIDDENHKLAMQKASVPKQGTGGFIRDLGYKHARFQVTQICATAAFNFTLRRLPVCQSSTSATTFKRTRRLIVRANAWRRFVCLRQISTATATANAKLCLQDGCSTAGFIPLDQHPSGGGVCLLTSDVTPCLEDIDQISQHASPVPFVISCIKCSSWFFCFHFYCTFLTGKML